MALPRALPERPFAVELWDGTTIPGTTPDAPRFRLRSPRALAHILRRPGELGIGRAYVSGLLEVDDLDAAIDLVSFWEPPPIPRRRLARMALAAVRACGLVAPPPVPEIELRQRGRLHSLVRDRSAVAYHYDAGNEFFKLFLDPTMTYSCGIFSRGASTLEEAQRTKLELICTKLALQPGQRVLDVGCGWGSFAMHAAEQHGVEVLGITLSKEQAQLARERVEQAGLADRIEIRLADYRELAEEPFDAISSIGMVEHVGEAQIDVYARQLAALLRPGGRLLNHGIAELQPAVERETGPVSDRYVFPDGEALPLSRVVQAIERAGLTTEHVEGFAADYATTLTHWIDNFESHYDRVVELAGAERARVWRVYLRAARMGFERGLTSVYQVRCHKPAEPAGQRTERAETVNAAGGSGRAVTSALLPGAS
ncbi:MAG: cyclopropane-fatty-acyl-phospholipid synthase [Thermoleophilaceae bacterium]|nr:cyclopropane-fatty-acyl-phospholipid synthase [Thermoleophilaceae bacterium]